MRTQPLPWNEPSCSSVCMGLPCCRGMAWKPTLPPSGPNAKRVMWSNHTPSKSRLNDFTD